MAKCKDCSTDIGFLKKRCESCDAKFKAAEQERKAKEAEIAAEKAKLDAQQREVNVLAAAKNNLDISWDKFENKGEMTGHKFKSAYGNVEMNFACVNQKTWWLIASQSVDDWDWLENNRTIILFDEETRFIQDHDSLRSTDVYTNWADNVKCYEEHHIDITEAIPSFLEFYEANKYDSDFAHVPMRIGRHELSINLKEIRTLAAMNAVIQES